LGAALTLVREQGMHGLTMRAVAGELEQRPPSLNRNIASKDQLLDLVAEQALPSFNAVTDDYRRGESLGAGSRSSGRTPCGRERTRTRFRSFDSPSHGGRRLAKRRCRLSVLDMRGRSACGSRRGPLLSLSRRRRRAVRRSPPVRSAALLPAHAGGPRAGHRDLTGITDWTAVAALYDGLVVYTPAVGADVARTAAVSRARGAVARLRLLDDLPSDRVAGLSRPSPLIKAAGT
jgi:AcrR family transcriptional regulator